MTKSHNPKIEALLWSWLSFAWRFRLAVIIFWALLAGLGLWLSVMLLGINTDTSDMIDARVPYRVAQSEFDAAFPDINDQILIVLRADSQDALDIYAGALTDGLQGSDLIRAVSHPPSDPFFQRNGFLYLPTDELETQLAQLTEAAPLIERLTLSPALDTLFGTLEKLTTQDEVDENAQALLSAVSDTLEANLSGQSQPLSWQAAFSQEGDEQEGDAADIFQTVIVIDPVLDHSRVRAAAPVQDFIETLGQSTNEATGISAQLSLTGNPVLRSDELKSVSRGIGLAFLISFFIVGIILFIALRSPILVICVLLSLVISILITAGLAALIYGELNLVSVAFTVLMVGLGVDFAIHLLMHLQSKRREGLSIPAIFYRTSRNIGTALVLTAPSTALAFLAFAPTRFVGISQLGVIAAIGVCTAFLVATSLLPAVFSYLPAQTVKPRAKEITPQGGAQIDAVQIDAVKGRSRMAVLVILLGLLALTLMPKARFDADPMALRDRSAPSVTAFNMLFDDRATVPYRLSLLADDHAAAAQRAASLEGLETVDSVRSLQNFVPEEQFDKLDLIDYAAIGLEFALSGEGDAPDVSESPVDDLLKALRQSPIPAAQQLLQVLTAWQDEQKDKPQLRAQSERDIFLYWPHQLERLRAQIQPSEITLEDLPRSIASRYQAQNGAQRLEILPAKDLRNIENRREFIAQVKQMAPTVTGSARSVQDAGDIIRLSMLQAILTALISVSLLLYLVVRNVKLVIIMLIPLLLAGVLTTATGVILNLPYNFANVIVLPLLIGIGVDSSLHLALQAKSQRDAKPRSAFDNVTARAVVFSAVTTIASFGSLSFSAHRGTSSMGMLLMIAIIWVLICTLSVTPALLRWTSHKREQM